MEDVIMTVIGQPVTKCAIISPPPSLQAEQEKEMARRRAAAAEQERLAADRVNLHIKAGKQAHAQQTKDEAALQKVGRR